MGPTRLRLALTSRATCGRRAIAAVSASHGRTRFWGPRNRAPALAAEVQGNVVVDHPKRLRVVVAPVRPETETPVEDGLGLRSPCLNQAKTLLQLAVHLRQVLTEE